VTRARIPAHVIEQARRQSPAACLLPFSYLKSRITVNMPKAKKSEQTYCARPRSGT
jgi:hypothetical protein